ncbi:MAG: 2-hydroxyacyl-CoA dehydratase, partial [Candidatus Electrothrix sp. AUS1_2]|nr:2-hydroxyacyl-CoA dehydratase [Candidatus Electrothrix sp. AUS1_2]
SPMALPNWKVHNLVEGAGAVIVNEESCIGTRYFKDLIDESVTGMDNMLAALTDRYKEIDCSCFTPNNERIEQVVKEFRDSKAQGIINYSLQFCHTYNIEEVRIREACEQEGIPYLFIESDYSPEDTGQLQTRIEAFLEQLSD